MARLKWNQPGKKIYETGVDHGVLYPMVDGKYPKGVEWGGLTSVSESPSGGEDNKFYADNVLYLNVKSAEEYEATIECYYYPTEFGKCNGETDIVEGVTLGQQRRQSFGFSYRTKKGNDEAGMDYGFKLHLVYGCMASPSEKSYNTVNESVEPGTFSYSITSVPVEVSGVGPDGYPYKPVSSIVIDSTLVDKDKMKELEDILYGTSATGDDGSGTEPRLPLPDELMTIFAAG